MSLQRGFMGRSELTMLTSELLLRGALRLWCLNLVNHQQVSLE